MAKGQRKIDSWVVEHDADALVFDIYISRQENKIGAQFIARPRQGDNHRELTFTDTDIDRLESTVRKAAIEALSRSFKAYFLLTFNGNARPSTLSGDYYGSSSATASLEVNRFLITEPDEKGRRFSKSSPGQSASEFRKELGLDKGGYNHGRVIGLVEDTPATRIALERIFAGFEDLNERLRDLLDVSKIEANLNLLAGPGGRLLMAGSPANEEKTK